jgi:hypothetical protein
MLYMGISLALTASGLLLCYLLWDVRPADGRTMNAVLAERLMGGLPFGGTIVVLTLLSEAMLLVVAAQAGFLDGPRVLANMAADSWVPHRFAALSDRLTTQNGILVMGAAAVAALLYTRGAVSHLVVMYSINVFLTFSLSMLAMTRLWYRRRDRRARWQRLLLFGAGLTLCSTILAVTTLEKFADGGWITVAITSLVVAGCLLVRRHYQAARERIDHLFRDLEDLPDEPSAGLVPGELVAGLPTAGLLVESYGGVGIHAVLNLRRAFPGHFRQVVFLSVGVLDSVELARGQEVEAVRRRTAEMLERYVALARRLGLRATARVVVGTEVVAEAERLCLEVSREWPEIAFFTGKLVFQRERWWHGLLHNQTARAIQRRLEWAGKTMVTLPIRVRSTS